MTATSETLPLAPVVATPPRRRGWGGDVIGSVAILSLVVVTALWLRTSGLQALTGPAAPSLTSLGRVLGLWSADLLLLQCLLMARIPWAERAWGQDTLARWHRWVGFTSFWAMVGHIVFVVLGYSAGDGHGLLRELWDMIVTYPGMLLATAGTAAIVMVVVTSVRLARRRLRYESWHLLHLYAYLGVGLALPHEIWTGTDFIGSPLARTYWWTLWAAAAVSVLVFRVAVPLWRTTRHDLRVSRVVREAPGVVSLHLAGRELHRLRARAGQFFVLRFLDGTGWTRANPYSLSAAPHRSMLRVTVQELGDNSARAARLRPGTRVLFEGPYGRLTADARTDVRRPVVLLGSGVGITPLRALLEDIDAPGRTTLLYRVHDEKDILFRREIDALACKRGVRVVPLVGRRAREGSWLPREYQHVDDVTALRRLVPEIAEAEVYVCGSPGWADTAAAAVRGAGVPPSRIHEEKFAW